MRSLLIVTTLLSVAIAFQGQWNWTSGYVPVNAAHHAALWYWQFPAQQPSNNLVLWLTGGPGCSSGLAALFENGPFWIDSQTGKPVNNPSGWNQVNHLLFVDNPAGVGFSVCDEDYVKNEKQVADDLYTFLTTYFQTDGAQYANMSFFITGESYGGHYVPALAARIVAGNQANPKVYINLVGAAIGNGWIDPITQYGSYGEYAYENNLIDDNTYASMNQTYQQCYQYLSQQDWDDAEDVCGGIMQQVLEYAGNINYYNIKLPCVGSLCYDFTAITNYLNNAKVQRSLNVKSGITWEACNQDINGMFGVDREESFKYDLPTILSAGVSVLIYNGKLDLICNYIGGEMLLANMQWPYQQQFNNQQYQNWVLNGNVVGQFKSAGNLTFLAVENAGHMVPHDVPAVAQSMLQLFLNGQPFTTSKKPF